MNRKYIIIGLLAIIAVALFFAIKKSKDSSSQAKSVSIELVTERDIIESVTASGKIYAEEEVKISSDVSGEIIQLLVKEGQSVQKGDLLAKIQPESYQAIVERAEAEYNNAIANLKNMQANHANTLAKQKQVDAQLMNAELAYQRAKKLYETQSISTAEMEDAETAYQTAQAEVDAIKESIKGANFSVEGAQAAVRGAQAAIRDAQSNLSKTSIYAPMSGIISLLNVEQGEKVVGTLQMTGTEMMRITNFQNMEVRVDVSESEIIKVRVGDTAQIEVDAYFEQKFQGIVTQVSNTSKGSADLDMSAEQSSNFVVRVGILEESYQNLLNENPRPFLPGMSATVDIFTKEVKNATAVPIQSVVTREDSTHHQLTEVVFVAQDGKAIQTPVKTGIQDDVYIQILEGLSPNQNIITGPYDVISRSLNNNDAIQEVKVKK